MLSQNVQCFLNKFNKVMQVLSVSRRIENIKKKQIIINMYSSYVLQDVDISLSCCINPSLGLIYVLLDFTSAKASSKPSSWHWMRKAITTVGALLIWKWVKHYVIVICLYSSAIHPIIIIRIYRPDTFTTTHYDMQPIFSSIISLYRFSP